MDTISTEGLSSTPLDGGLRNLAIITRACRLSFNFFCLACVCVFASVMRKRVCSCDGDRCLRGKSGANLKQLCLDACVFFYIGTHLKFDIDASNFSTSDLKKSVHRPHGSWLPLLKITLFFCNKKSVLGE